MNQGDGGTTSPSVDSLWVARKVADNMEKWVRDADVDGLNLVWLDFVHPSCWIRY